MGSRPATAVPPSAVRGCDRPGGVLPRCGPDPPTKESLLAERHRQQDMSGDLASAKGEVCYCGTRMVDIQACNYRCPNCGALLDCEDVSGLPK